jgi:hypothetical protein
MDILHQECTNLSLFDFILERIFSGTIHPQICLTQIGRLPGKCEQNGLQSSLVLQSVRLEGSIAGGCEKLSPETFITNI